MQHCTPVWVLLTVWSTSACVLSLCSTFPLCSIVLRNANWFWAHLDNSHSSNCDFLCELHILSVSKKNILWLFRRAKSRCKTRNPLRIKDRIEFRIGTAILKTWKQDWIQEHLWFLHSISYLAILYSLVYQLTITWQLQC